MLNSVSSHQETRRSGILPRGRSVFTIFRKSGKRFPTPPIRPAYRPILPHDLPSQYSTPPPGKNILRYCALHVQPILMRSSTAMTPTSMARVQKSTAMYNLVAKLIMQGVPIDDIGIQAHRIPGSVLSALQANWKHFANWEQFANSEQWEQYARFVSPAQPYTYCHPPFANTTARFQA